MQWFGYDVLTEFAKDRSTGSTMLPITWHRTAGYAVSGVIAL